MLTEIYQTSVGAPIRKQEEKYMPPKEGQKIIDKIVLSKMSIFI